VAILYNCTDAVSSAEKKFGKDDARNVTTANAAVYLGGGLAILALLKYLSNRGNTLVVKEGSPDLLHDLGRGVALVALTHAAPFAWSRSRAAASEAGHARIFRTKTRARVMWFTERAYRLRSTGAAVSRVPVPVRDSPISSASRSPRNESGAHPHPDRDASIGADRGSEKPT